MKAFVVKLYRKMGGMRLGEMPETVLREDEVLEEIHAGSGGGGIFAIQEVVIRVK